MSEETCRDLFQVFGFIGFMVWSVAMIVIGRILRAEASHPIMSWGWRLAGYCLLAVFSAGVVVAFAAAIGYAFKVIP